jgi:hypothetical protein
MLAASPSSFSTSGDAEGEPTMNGGGHKGDAAGCGRSKNRSYRGHGSDMMEAMAQWQRVQIGKRYLIYELVNAMVERRCTLSPLVE